MANIASALENSPHITAICQAVATDLAETSFSPLLMYVVDQAPEEALFYLAEQFNVLGWRGWNLANDAETRRALIKKAIELQRVKGTPFAIKEAVRTLGFEDADVVEGIGIEYDATYNHDGAITYAGGNWATFRVRVAVGHDVAINPTLSANLRSLIEAYKNARSHLLDVSYAIQFADTLEPSEELEYDGNELSERLAPGIYHDGTVSYDASETHNNKLGELNIKIYKNGTLIENATY